MRDFLPAVSPGIRARREERERHVGRCGWSHDMSSRAWNADTCHMKTKEEKEEKREL